jgi:hypothetical protein
LMLLTDLLLHSCDLRLYLSQALLKSGAIHGACPSL